MPTRTRPINIESDLTPVDVDAFWSKVKSGDDDTCWLWEQKRIAERLFALGAA